MRGILGWVGENARELLTMASLAAISVGCGMERASLALIVPGVIVFCSLVTSHLSGRT